MGVECADEGRRIGRGYGKWRCRDVEVSGNKRGTKESYSQNGDKLDKVENDDY